MWFQTERWRWKTPFRWWLSTPPESDLTSKWYNVCSIRPISSFRNYVELQIHLCLFSTKFLKFVCFPWFQSFLTKNCTFLAEKPYIAGKQTKWENFSKNEKLGSWRCLFIPQVLQNIKNWEFYVCPKLYKISNNYNFRKNSNFSHFLSWNLNFQNFVYRDVTLDKHKILSFWDFVALGGWKDIFMIPTFHFC